MTSNNLTPTLVAYSLQDGVTLTEIRRSPERFPRLRTFTQEENTARMLQIVWAATLYRNQEIPDEKLDFIASALVSEIFADRKYGLKDLSWTEIGYAIRSAVLSEGLFGISVSTLYNALVRYATGEGHDAERKIK